MNIDELSYPPFEKGSVWLVGAGPGDPSMLTLCALYAIKNADIIVYDALVSEAILSLSKTKSHQPILEYAGKRGGKPSVAQRAISNRLIELAKAGNRVCRLKGGDPLVFARGAEEAILLRKNNVPFRIVSGITAAIGGVANAYIPLTHRKINHNVTFLTGHDAGGKVPSLDWQAIARGGGILVFYMAMRNIKIIAEKLIAGGRRANEPIAFLSNVSTANETIYISELGKIAKSGVPKLAVPAIIVIGETIKYREKFLQNE